MPLCCCRPLGLQRRVQVEWQAGTPASALLIKKPRNASASERLQQIGHWWVRCSAHELELLSNSALAEAHAHKAEALLLLLLPCLTLVPATAGCRQKAYACW